MLQTVSPYQCRCYHWVNCSYIRGEKVATFLADDTQMQPPRPCVIKEFEPSPRDESQTAPILLQKPPVELLNLKSLGLHPQIPVHDYFFWDNKFYLVREYVGGESLAERVQQRGPLSEIEVKVILPQLLEVLEYVHSKNIIHGNINPENIILRSTRDIPVLVDFGGFREAFGLAIRDTTDYMPPEQLAGRPVFAGDVYSLGLTIIYALTGTTPSQSPFPVTEKMWWGVSISPNLREVGVSVTPLRC